MDFTSSSGSGEKDQGLDTLKQHIIDDNVSPPSPTLQTPSITDSLEDLGDDISQDTKTFSMSDVGVSAPSIAVTSTVTDDAVSHASVASADSLVANVQAPSGDVDSVLDSLSSDKPATPSSPISSVFTFDDQEEKVQTP